jgi:hypothetical protein
MCPRDACSGSSRHSCCVKSECDDNAGDFPT